MGAYETEWGVLTCHDQWIFVRLHKGAYSQQAYVTFSSVEGQSNNTKPFRALLGMLLAAEYEIDVPSHANMQVMLAKMVDESQDQVIPPSERSQCNISGPTNEPCSITEGQRVAQYPLRRRHLSEDMNPGIHVSREVQRKGLGFINIKYSPS